MGKMMLGNIGMIGARIGKRLVSYSVQVVGINSVSVYVSVLYGPS